VLILEKERSKGLSVAPKKNKVKKMVRIWFWLSAGVPLYKASKPLTRNVTDTPSQKQQYL
jgi:hypothetical protein